MVVRLLQKELFRVTIPKRQKSKHIKSRSISNPTLLFRDNFDGQMRRFQRKKN